MNSITSVPMKRKFTFDDALAAAEALREISVGHEQAAAVVLDAAGLDGSATRSSRRCATSSASKPDAGGGETGSPGGRDRGL